MTDLHIINSVIEKLEEAKDDKDKAKDILIDQLSYLHFGVEDDSDDYTNTYLEEDVVDGIIRLLGKVLYCEGRTDQYVKTFDQVIEGIQANKGRLMGD